MPVVGVISDTHGLLRDEARAALAGSDLILHAGDIGKADVIDRLAEIAPVTAVRGNVDRGDWASSYPDYEIVRVDNVNFYLVHRIEDLDRDPVAAGIRVVVTGHSHKPHIRNEQGVVYLNPGSAGPRRFTLPICLARVVVDGDSVQANLVHLET